MELGKVVGTVVATRKDEGLKGRKIQVVNLVNCDMSATGEFVVAVDTVGAGVGEVVLVVRGSSARVTTGMSAVPVDACIVAILDSVEIQGKRVFDKARDL
ncbi:MAG: EutN/CcmL family microcompartment protein [Candidatus Glassbacteria bacterium]|nr:EutN/CcmL family microcompartment protein [Candidatus Glassbacteria bacterium]